MEPTESTHGGMSTHNTTVNGQFVHTTTLETYAKATYAYQILVTIGLSITKVAVILNYRRIFSIHAFCMINNVLIAVTMAWDLAFTFVVVFQCTPISTLWDKFEHEFEPYCIHVLDFYMSIAISDLIMDVVIFILPIPQIWQLRLPTRQRFAVASIFLTGSMQVLSMPHFLYEIPSSNTAVMSLPSGLYSQQPFIGSLKFIQTEPMLYVQDILWYHPSTLFWHLAENVIGLLGCCLPCYAPLVRSFQSMVTSKKGSTMGSGNPL